MHHLVICTNRFKKLKGFYCVYFKKVMSKNMQTS